MGLVTTPLHDKITLVNDIISFLHAHYFAIAAIGAYVFTAAVAALPKPGSPAPTGALIYQFSYDFFHVLANKVVERYPKASAVVTTSTVASSANGDTVSTTEKVSVPAPNVQQ